MKSEKDKHWTLSEEVCFKKKKGVTSEKLIF